MPVSAAFVPNAEVQRGTQKLAVLAVDFTRVSGRSFNDSEPACSRFADFRPFRRVEIVCDGAALQWSWRARASRAAPQLPPPLSGGVNEAPLTTARLACVDCCGRVVSWGLVAVVKVGQTVKKWSKRQVLSVIKFVIVKLSLPLSVSQSLPLHFI